MKKTAAENTIIIEIRPVRFTETRHSASAEYTKNGKSFDRSFRASMGTTKAEVLTRTMSVDTTAAFSVVGRCMLVTD